MSAKTLVQKFKVYTEVNELDRSTIYDFLYVQKAVLFQGNTLSIHVNSINQLNITVDHNDSRTIVICHPTHMSVWVGRHYRSIVKTGESRESNWSTEYEFNINYDITPEWMFQISTQYDLGFLEHRYIKYLTKLNNLYSTEEEAEETA